MTPPADGGGAAPTTPATPPDPTTPVASAAAYQKHGHCWWPQGDVGKLRRAATAWSTLAAAIDQIAADGDQAVGGLKSSSGSALDAFTTFWNQKYSNGTCAAAPAEGAPALTNLAATCRSLAESCDTYATGVENARNEVITLTAAAASVIVLGAALTFVTFGGSDVAAAGADTAIVAEAAAVETSLASTIGAALTRIGLAAVEGALAAGEYDALIVQPIERYYEPGRKFSWDEVGRSAEFGAVAGGLGQGIGEGAGPLAGRLAQTLGSGDARFGPALSNAITGTTRALDTPIGRALSGGATAAGLDEATTGQVNPLDVGLGVAGGLASGIGRGAGGRSGDTERPTAEGSTGGEEPATSPTDSHLDQSSGGPKATDELPDQPLADPPTTALPRDESSVSPSESDLEFNKALETYNALGVQPPRIRISANDAEFPQVGHTLDRHGSDLPLYRADAPPGEQTIEGRIYGDPPWGKPENSSYRWVDSTTMQRTVDEYINSNWDDIRLDFAMNDGVSKGSFDAGHLTGDGFYNAGRDGVGPRQATYAQTSWATVVLRLVPGSDPPRVMVVSAYPLRNVPGSITGVQ